jgi:hypothetical protein
MDRCPHCGVGLLRVRDAFCPECREDLDSAPACSPVDRERTTVPTPEFLSKNLAENRNPARVTPPICSRCPNCGRRESFPIRSARIVTFQSDRECETCGTHYSPPTPVWGATIFILLGITFTAGCGISLLLAIAHGPILALPSNVLFLALGVLCIRHGIQSLREVRVTAPEVVSRSSRFNIEECDHCGTRVIATSDGLCPACQMVRAPHARD